MYEGNLERHSFVNEWLANLHGHGGDWGDIFFFI